MQLHTIDEEAIANDSQGANGSFDRRNFLLGAAGVAASAGIPSWLAAPSHAQTPGVVGSTPKIDVHAHYLPNDYRQALIDNGHAMPDGFPVLPTWTLRRTSRCWISCTSGWRSSPSPHREWASA